MMEEKLRYPVGKYQPPAEASFADIAGYIDTIESFPQRLRNAVSTLNDSQLDTRYRPEGWTVRQVVHHVADSHVNAYCRFKLALTEDIPRIKPYLEARWAELPDSKATIHFSLPVIEGVHKRWVIILESMTSEDFERKLFHPEQNKEIPLKNMAALYSWHSNHHLAHITELKKREGWS